MAIYHFSAQIIGRSTGRSSVAAAAYRAGREIVDERTGERFDYTRKQGVLDHAVLTPSRAPDWAKDSATLWNAAEAAENRKDAQLCREIKLALPHELTLEQNRALVHGFVREQFIKRGMAAQVDIHAPHREGDQRNIHAHVMLTLRQITRDGFKAKKPRNWNTRETLKDWREQWEQHINRELEKAKVKERVDSRSLKQQGIEREPTKHLGPTATAMERQGKHSERGDINRAVHAFNEAKEQAKVIDLAIEREKREIAAEEARKQQQRAQAEALRQREALARRKAAQQRQREEQAAFIRDKQAQAQTRQPDIWDRDRHEARQQKQLSEAAIKAAEKAQEREKGLGRGVSAPSSQNAPAGLSGANDNRSGQQRALSVREAAALSAGKLDEWKGQQQAAQQSRQFDERIEMERRHDRQRMALEERQRRERGADIRHARKTLTEIEARQQCRGFKRLVYRMSGEAEKDREQAEAQQASIGNANWRTREERSTLQSRQDREREHLEWKHKIEARVLLEKTFKDIDKERERQQHPEKAKAREKSTWDEIQERRAQLARERSRDRGFDFER
jgi:hypothetical protein